MRTAGKGAEASGDRGEAGAAKQGHGQVAAGGEGLRSGTGADGGPLRVEGHGANKTFTVRVKDESGQMKEMTYSLYRDEHGVMRVAPPGEEKGRKRK